MSLFSKNKDVQIFAPCDGEIIGLEKVEDEVFSEKMLGDGFAIDPANGDFVAPMEGKLVTVFPSGHAYGIKHKSGLEALLHIGLDTVSLDGVGFDIKVKQGESVKVGAPLVMVDLEGIRSKVPSLKTPLVFTQDSLEGKTIEVLAKGKVKKGDLIAVIK
ncbi:PTS sugar transporter subunit IIA [Spiroplasma alleghenense]|uniref:PTS system glucose-specific IIA component n=1 Tax=Spiroplasma alleghenense TaxID=216931 RepID=A0A345Z2F3_9MOLU|nr:PTS glucose transporter subunit IIA [Spiroplasma alleghenense]AXK50782.1 PTS system glucose-specific IIA component [Spiroplasma alleghenense]